MSQAHNPYTKPASHSISTQDDDNVSMHDSPHSKSSDSDESKQADEHDTEEADCSQRNEMEEEQIDFKDTPFQIPPSFSRSIMEETLWDDDHPYVFWVSL